MIQMDKWDNYDSAPPKPFFKIPSGPDATKKLIPINVSPGKSVQLKRQLVDQLLKWHQLLEKGRITQEELQESIMKDFDCTIHADDIGHYQANHNQTA